MTGQAEIKPLSVVILTHNEEVNLPACLASTRGLDCNVFVVDSGSSDRTVEIARSAGATVAVHPFEHYGAQRNWAMKNLGIETPWTLHLDADERLSPELRDSISRAIANPNGYDGFMVGKAVFFMGRQIRYGGIFPSWHLRLFKSGLGRCEDRLYDQHFVLDGKAGHLRGSLFDVIGSDLTSWTARHNRWSDMEVMEIQSQGSAADDQVQARIFGTSIERRRWYRNRLFYRLPPFSRGFLYFIWRYLVRLGFLDGKPGLIFHFLHSCWYRFLVDAKLYQSQIEREAGQLRTADSAGSNEPHPQAAMVKEPERAP
jgi:glycosyltransferase involved in cell wall biosynthesis